MGAAGAAQALPPPAAPCTTGKPGQGCLLPAPSQPSAGRVAVRVPHGDKNVSAVQQDLFAVAGGTTIHRSGDSRSPSETGSVAREHRLCTVLGAWPGV